MIALDQLVALRQLFAVASKPPMVLAPLNGRQDQVQIATVHPGAVHVAMTHDDAARPEVIATARAMANARCIVAAFEWMPALLDAVIHQKAEIERLRSLVGATESGSGDDSGRESDESAMPSGADKGSGRRR